MTLSAMIPVTRDVVTDHNARRARLVARFGARVASPVPRDESAVVLDGVEGRNHLPAGLGIVLGSIGRGKTHILGEMVSSAVTRYGAQHLRVGIGTTAQVHDEPALRVSHIVFHRHAMHKTWNALSFQFAVADLIARQRDGVRALLVLDDADMGLRHVTAETVGLIADLAEAGGDVVLAASRLEALPSTLRHHAEWVVALPHSFHAYSAVAGLPDPRDDMLLRKGEGTVMRIAPRIREPVSRDEVEDLVHSLA